jgi:cytochrome c553
MKWLVLLVCLPVVAYGQDAPVNHLAAPSPVTAADEAAPPKAALCAYCHGAKGVPVNKMLPVIAGQNQCYLYLELRDYKLGNRKNPAMQAVAAQLEKQDMKDLAAYYAAQSWPVLAQPAPPDDVLHRAQQAEKVAVCASCHGNLYHGDSAIPRVAGQQVDYLKATMQGFRSGERANNPFMASLLKTYTDEDIEALARHLAGM